MDPSIYERQVFIALMECAAADFDVLAFYFRDCGIDVVLIDAAINRRAWQAEDKRMRTCLHPDERTDKPTTYVRGVGNIPV